MSRREAETWVVSMLLTGGLGALATAALGTEPQIVDPVITAAATLAALWVEFVVFAIRAKRLSR